MDVITIPKKLAQKDDLVVIPRREYELFSRWKKAVKVRINDAWFWTPEWQKKEVEADTAIRLGRIYGPFSNYDKLLGALKNRKR